MAKAQREVSKPSVSDKLPQAADDELFGDEPQAEPAPIEPIVAEDVEAEPALVEDVMAGWSKFPSPPTPGHYGALPYNHAPVWLTSDGLTAVVVQWQTSRRWAGRKGMRWEPYGFWAQRDTGGRPIGFEPKGWRECRD